MKTKGLLSLAMATMLLVSLAISACSQAPSAPTPTQPRPAATTGAEQPRAAATAAPTPVAPPTKAAAPTAEKGSFPTKGKTITLIAPYAAGGTSDVMARVLAPFLEKELGTTVVVVNKPGANSQVGITELVKSKPDGYTIGTFLIPDVITIYLDPDRNAVFGRKELEPLAIMARQPCIVAVKPDSPIKDLQGLVDAAKAKELSAGTPGIMSVNHLSGIQWQRLTGTKFSYVHFDGVTGALTALQGGHVDVLFGGASPPVVAAHKAEQVRVLGVMDKQPHPFLVGVKTFELQGFPLQVLISYCWALPAGTPKDVVDTLGAVFRKAAQSEEVKARMVNAGLSAYYGDAAEMAKLLADTEAQVKPLIELAKQESRKR